MSTRCQIFIVDEREGHGNINDPCVMIYRHSDGYPEGKCGVVAALVEFLPKFMKHRGWDTEYMGAQLIASMIQGDKDYMIDMYQRRMDKAAKGSDDAVYYKKRLQEAKEEVDFLGYGISREIHGDIEYAYVITRKGVRVFDVTQDKKGNYLSWEERVHPHKWLELTKPVHRKMIMEGRTPKMFKQVA